MRAGAKIPIAHGQVASVLIKRWSLCCFGHPLACHAAVAVASARALLISALFCDLES
jgi:hypothetical protein